VVPELLWRDDVSAAALPEHVATLIDEPAVVWGCVDGDRLDEFFEDVTVTDLPGIGHFSPLEAPQAWADAIRRHL
jgi:hypothetical protein